MYSTIFYTNKFKDLNDNYYQLLIQKENYTGSSYNIKLADGYSLTHTLRGGRDAEYLPVQGSELNFSLLTENDDNLLKDSSFDFNYLYGISKFWKEKIMTISSGSLSPSTDESLNTILYADGGDFTNILYQNNNFESGVEYKLVIEFKIDDAANEHVFAAHLFNESDTSISQQILINVDDEIDIVKTIKFTANSNYDSFGLIAQGADVTVTIYKVELSKVENYFQLMTTDYNQYKVNLYSESNIIQNSNFDKRLQYWKSQINDNNYWDYSNTYKAIQTIVNETTDVLYQNHNIDPNLSYDFNLSFGVSAINNTKVYVRFYSINIDFDPPTDVLICSGSSGTWSYVNIDFDQTNSYSLGTQNIFEFTGQINPIDFYTGIGFFVQSNNVTVNLLNFKVSEFNKLQFSGWIKPDNIYRRFLDEKYFIDINAIDGLADLKNVEYLANYSYTKIIDILINCLESTGLNLPIEIQNNTFENSNSSFNWYDTYVHQSRWITSKKNPKEYASVYQVLEDILINFFVRLRQDGGRWVIQNISENETKRLLQISGSSFISISDKDDRIVDITDYPFIKGSDEIGMIAPIKSLTTTVNNTLYEDSFIFNSEFDLDLQSWSGSTNWTQFIRNSGDGNGFLNCRINSTAGGTSFYTVKQLAVVPDIPPSIYVYDSRIKISFDLSLISRPLPAVDSTPLLRVYAWRQRSGFDTGTVGEVREIQLSGLTIGEWNNYEFEYQLFSDINTYNIILLEIQLVSFTSGKEYEFYLDNVYMTFDYKKKPDEKSKVIISTDNPNPLLENRQIELEFGDSRYTNDQAAIMLSNDPRDFTSNWSNGSITGVTLSELYSTMYFNQNSKYKKYLKVDVLDSNCKINSNSLVRFNGTTYRIIGFSKQILTGTVAIECIEFINNELLDVVIDKYQSWTQYDSV